MNKGKRERSLHMDQELFNPQSSTRTGQKGSGTVNKRLTNCEQIFEKIEWRRMKTVEK